jgi:hypothetical protein
LFIRFTDYALWPAPNYNELLKLRILLDILVELLGQGSTHHKVSTNKGLHNTEKRGHGFIRQAGFEPTIPMFELSKTIPALDREAIRTGLLFVFVLKIKKENDDAKSTRLYLKNLR